MYPTAVEHRDMPVRTLSERVLATVRPRGRAAMLAPLLPNAVLLGLLAAGLSKPVLLAFAGLALASSVWIALRDRAPAPVAEPAAPSPEPALRQRIAQLEADAELGEMMRMGLKSLSAMVRIARHDGTVIFANDALVRHLKGMEPAVRRQYPDFRAEDMVGKNISTLYPDPDAALARLKALREPTRVRISQWEKQLDFDLVPIFDANGEQCGTFGQWIDMTDQVRAEEELVAIVGDAARGNFTRRLDVDDKSGQLRVLAEGVNHLLDSIQANTTEVAEVLAALSSGDLTRSIDKNFEGTFGELKNEVNATVNRLSRLIAQISGAAASVNEAAREIAAGNTDLSIRTANQAASLEETASSMEELTRSVRANTDNARQANKLARSASDVARKGGEAVSGVVGTMRQIEESSNKIFDIIGVVDGIAFQTNILALNAAVEAARAGEQGRGFAVVASEVRALAQRSAAAAKEIKDLIGASVKNISEGTRQVNEAGRTMDDMLGAVARVTGILGDVADASEEQSQGIEFVNEAITSMDDSTQQNAALVEQAAAAAGSLEQQAAGLVSTVSGFKLAG